MSSNLLKKDARIYVAGHRGLVGSAIVRNLRAKGYDNLLLRTSRELDLTRQEDTFRFLAEEKPDAVIVAAAKVGGIRANSEFPADFIAINLMIETNVIWGSHLAGVPNLLFLGSSCVYPRETAQPIPEEALLTGKPEPTNAPYAIAKIAGISLCESIQRQFGRRYLSAMPPNVYGPGDNYDLGTSHVLPALLRKFHEALPNRDVEVWGTGRPRREFLYSDDVADACVFLLNHPDAAGLVNVGTGQSISIAELAETIQRTVGHTGNLVWNTSMPDGFPEKTNDVSKLHSLGWRHHTSLEQGLKLSYRDMIENVLQ